LAFVVSQDDGPSLTVRMAPGNGSAKGGRVPLIIAKKNRSGPTFTTS
jgi:hypothetical protein